MLAKRPDPLDVMVGAKIGIFRTHRGLSQSDLAEKIGVAFQQVQKYESGANRVGASRLSRIAAALGVSIGELFEPSQPKSPRSKSPFDLLAERRVELGLGALELRLGGGHVRLRGGHRVGAAPGLQRLERRLGVYQGC